jgi:hypothetical protein
VDRYRKVVQPFKKQLTPRLAVQILLIVGFVFPLFLAVPGTIMCGIKRENMTNIYGGFTEINLCETEDKYRDSIWRKIYKIVLIILLIGISCCYVVLYVFVIKEAIKQIKAISLLRKSSLYEVTYSSDVYDPNAINLDAVNTKRLLDIYRENTEEKDAFQKQSVTFENNSPSPKNTNRKKVSKQLSLKSLRSETPIIRTTRFPTKTLVWFVLTIVFIITYLTHLILALKVSEIVNMSPSEFSWFSFFFRIYFFNHMINPIVYAIFVKKFRESCRTLIPTLKDRARDICIC